MPNGHQRYFCRECKQTFSESFGTLYYWRRGSPEQVQQVLQAHRAGSSLRGISRITQLAYNPVVSIVRSARPRGDPDAQLVHSDQVEQVMTEEVSADEMWGHLDVLSASTPRSPQKNRSDVFSRGLNAIPAIAI